MDLQLAFSGRRLRQVWAVVAHVPEGEIVLPDTAVFLLDDTLFQVLVDMHEKRCFALRSFDDVVIEGDYEDRTATSFRCIASPDVRVEDVQSVWEPATETDNEYLIGIFLMKGSGSILFGLNLHLDDLIFSDARTFWCYIAAVMETSGTVVLRAGSVPLSD